MRLRSVAIKLYCVVRFFIFYATYKLGSSKAKFWHWLLARSKVHDIGVCGIFFLIAHAYNRMWYEDVCQLYFRFRETVIQIDKDGRLLEIIFQSAAVAGRMDILDDLQRLGFVGKQFKTP